MGLLEKEYNPGIALTTIDSILNWAKRSSIWPLTFGIACCAIEMIITGSARFDMSRFGAEVFRATPRQADLMIVCGTVNQKMAPRLKLLYDQMPAHKKVIAMGSCAISGGPYVNTYNVVNGADLLVPVDVYVPGCPPRPEALLDGIMKLQALIDKETLARKKA